MRFLPALFLLASSLLPAADPLAWPAAPPQTRPWSYWWWMASAVDRENITHELERFRAAGWGGVHIIPIYGAKGYESRYIEYLSPKWMEMLAHTVREARRLGMDVDMTTGSGWCFGGPNVTEQDACKTAGVQTFDVAEGAGAPALPPDAQGIVAFGPGGRRVDLKKTDPAAWRAEGGPWKIYALSERTSRLKVKRAAPGGEGWMLNPLYPGAIDRYLERFTRAFAAYKADKPRAMYHDSFEYQVNWSPDFFDQFAKRRGYRLEDELPSLFGADQGDRAARVKSDYRETVSDLMVETFIPNWVAWSHRHGFITRNQAHGSPGNLLDLYAPADVPETEMFNRDRNSLVSKFASSAAHVEGRTLVASETGTWLKEHFTETLADMKELVDQLFLAGINHIVYHGSCYSPDDVPWPGWLFYASTEMNSRNPIWRDVPALNSYITRSQGVLQAGSQGNEILLYWPVYDVWDNAKGLAMNLTVHGRAWLEGQRVSEVAEKLWRRGYGFDLASDRQLRRGMPAGYRAVVVPRCERMPAETVEALARIAKAGTPVIFDERMPADVPGLGRIEERRAAFQRAAAGIRPRARTGDVEALLEAAGVHRERLVDHAGLEFIRRSIPGGAYYFIANRGTASFDGWVPLNAARSGAGLMDPMTGRTGTAQTRGAEIRLQLEPGESIIVRAGAGKAPAWSYRAFGREAGVSGSWHVEFIAGGPELPAAYDTDRLESWTSRGEAYARFGGTARYSAKFDAAGGGAWWIDLGRVAESARVKVNGREAGVAFMTPYRLLLENLKPAGNTLEIEVTNLAANRIRDLDRRKVKWHEFHDIGFVNLDYKPFDASGWPVRESGLLGPVKLRR